MLKVKRLSSLLLLGFLLAGCTTSTITKLTPDRTFRNPNGLYSVEAAFTTEQQTLRWNSIRPQVIVGGDTYPMRQTRLMTNRWETLIPVPADKDVVTYRFKFDFDYNDFGSPGRSDSKLSPPYKMTILPNQ